MAIADRFKTRAGMAMCTAIVIAVALVVLRSIVPVMYEQFDFDSDQAIVGLMAKHASELRVFPLFFYGQPYMLGVQAWIAAPFFWIGGPTLAMLRLPLVLLNVAAPVLLIVMLARRGVSPLFTLVAALPIAATTPAVSAALVETLGASVEPLVYVLLLWRLRDRPIAFGALLAVGTLHREFTIFAVPAAIVATWIEGRTWTRAALLRMTAAFAGVWLMVAALARTVNNLGPAGGARETAALADEARLIASWLSFRPAPYAARLWSLLTAGLPDLAGGRSYVPLRYNVNSGLTVGSHLAGGLLAVALAACAWRLGVCLRHRSWRRVSLSVYLVIVALEAIAAYGLNGGIDPAAPAVLRYVLFALLLPVGLLSACFLADGSTRWRLAIAACVTGWAVLTTGDNVRVLTEYRLAPPPSEFRALADYLVAHGIRYGTAQYWDCYIVDFLSRERVVLASTGAARIASYQARVERNAASAARIVRQPCTAGERIASWCIEVPPAR